MKVGSRKLHVLIAIAHKIHAAVYRSSSIHLDKDNVTDYLAGLELNGNTAVRECQS
jgi:hypothetical protein